MANVITFEKRFLSFWEALLRGLFLSFEKERKSYFSPT